MELLFLALAALLCILFLWAIFAVCAALVAAVLRFAFRSSSNQDRIVRNGRRLSHVALSLFIAWSVYIANYPDDSFYLGEYQTVTDHPPPPDAAVLAKHATYPDFHGEYCSFSRIKLSPNSYSQLLSDLQADRRFELNSKEFLSTTAPNGEALPPAKIVSTFTRKDTAIDHHYSIQFLANDELIEVHVCVT